MSGQREIAEEVTQEVFLALLSEPGLYDAERGSLQGYLIGVARNKARQALAQSAHGKARRLKPRRARQCWMG